LTINKNCKLIQNKKTINMILIENEEKKNNKKKEKVQINDTIEFKSEEEIEEGKGEIKINFKGQCLKKFSIFKFKNNFYTHFEPQ
jgi:hypothetical protein